MLLLWDIGDEDDDFKSYDTTILDVGNLLWRAKIAGFIFGGLCVKDERVETLYKSWFNKDPSIWSPSVVIVGLSDKIMA